MTVVDGLRGLTVAGLAIAAWTGHLTILGLAVFAFLLGLGEMLFEPAGEAYVPELVGYDAEALREANGRIAGTYILGQRFAGRPVGGFVFGVAPWLAFAFDALSFGASSALIATIDERTHPQPPEDTARRRLVSELRTGARWLWHHPPDPPPRRLSGGDQSLAAVYGAIFVVFATERLQAGPRIFGLMSTGLAVGAYVGIRVAPRLARHLEIKRVLVGALVAGGIALLVVATSGQLLATAAVLTVVGAAAGIWNVTSISIRQLLVPAGLFGRVAGVYRFLTVGCVPLGAVLGGITARYLGMPAPFLGSWADRACRRDGSGGSTLDTDRKQLGP